MIAYKHIFIIFAAAKIDYQLQGYSLKGNNIDEAINLLQKASLYDINMRTKEKLGK